MKLHQRAWAAASGLTWITWTFDPLVRRNAWFNIEVLGAHVARVPRQLLRPDDRLDQRPRRVRPARSSRGRPIRRCRDPTSPVRRDDRRRRHACRHRRAAPDGPGRGDRVAPACSQGARRAARRRRHRPRLHPRRAVLLVAADESDARLRELRRDRVSTLVAPFRTSFGTQTSRASCSACRGQRPTSARAGASASPATSRPTRRSTSTVRRW